MTITRVLLTYGRLTMNDHNVITLLATIGGNNMNLRGKKVFILTLDVIDVYLNIFIFLLSYFLSLT